MLHVTCYILHVIIVIPKKSFTTHLTILIVHNISIILIYSSNYNIDTQLLLQQWFTDVYDRMAAEIELNDTLYYWRQPYSCSNIHHSRANAMCMKVGKRLVCGEFMLYDIMVV